MRKLAPSTILSTAFVALLLTTGPVNAHGTRVYLSFGAFYGAPYPHYYYPPPYYYYPAYYPPPVYYYPPPPVIASTASCRQFRGDATIDATGRPFYGTACLMPDGR